MASKRVIIVAGPSGTGKTTICRALAKKHKLRFVSGSRVFKKLLKKKNAKDWFAESKVKEGIMRERLKDYSFDELVDKEMEREARKGNVVLDSRTLPWLVDFGFKVWLEASPLARAKHIAENEGIPKSKIPEMVKSMNLRDKNDLKIYKKLYGFDLKPDSRVFNLIVRNGGLSIRENIALVDEAVSSYLKAERVGKR